MKYITFILLFISFLLIGCESSKDKVSKSNISALSDTNNSINIKKEETNTTQNQQDTIDKPIQQTNPKKDPRTLTIYVHGYDPMGESREGVFGQNSYDKVLTKIREFTNFDTTLTNNTDSKDMVALMSYYGSTPPSYYTNEDINEVKSADKGIPRYALIVAKFAKEMLKETNTTNLNIVSASMGSLVTRYMIEKNLENLSSKSIIKKWLSLEGVIKGNIASSNEALLTLANSLQEQPTEVNQMKYSWVDNNLDLNSKYYKDIDIAFESSTKDNLNNEAISKITKEANDGIQAVKDTFIENYPHTFFYENHLSLEDRDSAWGYVATFLTAKKRVKITLLSATISDLHEDRLFYGSILPAEIVFQSKVYSPKAFEKWDFDTPIDERVLKSYYLPIQKYKDENEEKELDQILFDSKVLDDEDTLSLKLTPYELDFEPMYGVKEVTGHGDYESLGEGMVDLPLNNGIYDLSGKEWDAKVKVEVF